VARVSAPHPGPTGSACIARPPWLIERDFDAVAAYLDPWILAAEPDHDPQTTRIPLLGTPDWVAANPPLRDASVAIYVLACLVEREPVVIAARLAAEGPYPRMMDTGWSISQRAAA
jgi:hypothetical protein